MWLIAGEAAAIVGMAGYIASQYSAMVAALRAEIADDRDADREIADSLKIMAGLLQRPITQPGPGGITANEPRDS